jgi:hypothetical protein
MTRLSTMLASVLACVPLATWAQANLAQEASAPAYCPDLKHVAALAMSQEKFASITGKPRQGNFSDATLDIGRLAGLRALWDH